mmetsp:Transcript_35680/g.96818  ORF Transcript_35680/g.96818 Transcript_35680/m.96818 type:complete len:223 (-) Transcript_35680:368-1036(-)
MPLPLANSSSVGNPAGALPAASLPPKPPPPAKVQSTGAAGPALRGPGDGGSMEELPAPQGNCDELPAPEGEGEAEPEGLQPAPEGAMRWAARLGLPLGSAFSMTETGDEGGGLAYFGGSASTSKALKSCRARLLATASLRKLRQSNRCSQVSMCTVESSASGTSSSNSWSAASTTSPRQRRPASPRAPAEAAAPPPRCCEEPEDAIQKGSLAVQRLGTDMLV